jgi:hypothetical protein
LKIDFNTKCDYDGFEAGAIQTSGHFRVMENPYSGNFNTSNSYTTLKVNTGSNFSDEIVDTYKEIWDKTCGFNGGKLSNGEPITTVFQGVQMNEEIPLINEKNRPGYREAVDAQTSGLNLGNNPFLNLCSFLVTLVYCIFVTYVLIRRFLDILMLALYSWIHVGNSLTEEDSSSLSLILKNLASICLTEFFVIFQMQLYINSVQNYRGQGGFNLTFLAYQLAWLMLLWNTPTIMQGVAHDTGAKQIGATILKKVTS